MAADKNTPEKRSFSEALIDLIKKAAELPPSLDTPELQENFDELCDILRIAKFTVYLKNKEYDNWMEYFTSDYDTVDPTRVWKMERVNPDKGEVIYLVYPYLGAPDWTEEELRQIDALVTEAYILNGRARVMLIADKLRFFDPVTELYNLGYFVDRLEKLLAKDHIDKYCVCRFNLRSFGTVNARLGHNRGTKVMKRFAWGLKDVVGESGLVCRIGGDNFITLFEKPLLEPVQKYLMGTYVKTDLYGVPEVTVSAHAGYYMIRSICTKPTDILDRITFTAAMAKANPAAPYIMYDDDLKKKREVKGLVESRFSDAIANEDFLVYYQPKIDLHNYVIYGAEALCRWVNDGKIVSPGVFIPILEQSDNICVLDFYILDHVCRDIRRWLDMGLPVVRVSVNMSRVHLGDGELCKQITEIIDKYNVPHEYVEIELTETTTDVDFKELKQIVSKLHDVGISTSVDDFGVGYSSLNLIRDLPWKVLKIDKSFLPNTAENNSAAKSVMLKHVISMANDLGLECIVEGIELEDQVDLVTNSGCYKAQGYRFDKPLPVNDYEARLADRDYYKKYMRS